MNYQKELTYTKQDSATLPSGGNILTTRLYEYGSNAEIGHCKVSMEAEVWTISEWFVQSEFQKQGLGKYLLNKTMRDFSNLVGLPEEAQYIWNGTNRYVFAWLTSHFEPISTCPIAVQKMMEETGVDDSRSHIYKLNVDKFVEYFNLGKELEYSR